MDIIILIPSKRKKGKKRENAGFSLMELLAATIILMLATLLVTQALDLAFKQFRTQVEEAEAQMLCSSLATAVQDELSYAVFPANASDNGTYFSMSRGMGKGCSIVAKNGEIYLSSDKGDYPLLSSAAYEGEIAQAHLYDAAVTYSAPNSANIVQVTVTVTNQRSASKSMASFDVKSSKEKAND